MRASVTLCLWGDATPLKGAWEVQEFMRVILQQKWPQLGNIVVLYYVHSTVICTLRFCN